MFEHETWKDCPAGDSREEAEADGDDILNDGASPDYGTRPTNSVEGYFREMARERMLTRKEETDLARKIASLKRRIAKWIRRYPALLREAVPGDEPESTVTSLEKDEITDALLEAMERTFTEYVCRIERAETTLTKCEERSGLSYQDILDSASKLQEGSGATVEFAIPQNELLSMQAAVLCSVYDLRAVEMEMAAPNERFKKEYREFLKVRILLQRLRSRFVEANLRLVVSMARKYRGRGVPFLDLIQEGNLGLMRAVDKFDYRLGYKFSTYAMWWIRQAMHRTIQNHARTIRTPIHVIEMKKKVMRAIQARTFETGSKPSLKDITRMTGLPKDKVEFLAGEGEWTIPQTVSLETPIGGGDAQLLDFVKDEESTSPEEASIERNVAARIKMILSTLTPREEVILRKRFGIGDDKTYTLEELGQEFGVTRERIRQIEAKALRKLRHHSRRKSIRGLDDF